MLRHIKSRLRGWSTRKSSTVDDGRYETLFDTQHLKTGIARRTVRGGAATATDSIVRLVLQLASTAILARLLVPDDFGLIAQVAAVTGFVTLFKDLGLSMATVHREKITHDQVSNLFWVNLVVSAAAMLIIFTLAPLLGIFYRDDRVIGVTLALAGMTLLGGASVQHQALLTRQMKFRVLATLRSGSLFAGIVAAVISAWYGASYWALVVQTGVSTLVTLIGVWVTCPWTPSGPKWGSGVMPMIRFGRNLTIANVVNYFSRNLDNVLIGWFWGSSALGIYSRSYNLLLQPLDRIHGPISAVAIPVLSRFQADPKKFRLYFRKGAALVLALEVPVVVFSCVCPHEIILTFLGPQWSEAVPIFLALIPAALISTTKLATHWVFVTWGRTDLQIRTTVVNAVAIVISFLIGLPHGPVGVAIAFSVCICLLRFPIIMYCFHHSPLRLTDLEQAMRRPVAASILAAGVLWLVRNSIASPDRYLLRLAVLFPLFCMLYTVLLLLLPGGRTFFADSLRYVRELKTSSTRV